MPTYIPEHFRVSDEQTLREFMQAHDFATMVSPSPEGLVTSHLPVLVRPAGATLMIAGHLARANPHWRLMNGATPALFLFHGPHGYVSPSWYAAAPAVPTWNYSVVHAHGRPTVREETSFIRGVLEELVARYEGRRPNGWRPESLPADYYERMLSAIVAFEMPVTRLEGKFKLGQNRSVEDRRRTIAGLEDDGSPEAVSLAEFMRRNAGV
jgi:transcriptional regulator